MQADTSERPALTLDGEATAILDAIDRAGGVPQQIADIAVAARISERTAADVTVRLAAVGVLTFRYDGHAFGIVRAE